MGLSFASNQKERIKKERKKREKDNRDWKQADIDYKHSRRRFSLNRPKFLIPWPAIDQTILVLSPSRRSSWFLPFQSWKWSASLLCSLLLLEIMIFSVLWVRVHDDGIHERKQKLLSAKNRWPLTILIPNHSLSTGRVLKVSSLCSSSSLSRLSWLSLGPSVPVFSFTALATPILCAATIDSRIVWIGSCRTASFASNHASLLLLLLSFNCTTYL